MEENENKVLYYFLFGLLEECKNEKMKIRTRFASQNIEF